MISLLVYFCILTFIVGTIYRFLKLLNRIHLRCELYPSLFSFNCESTQKAKRFKNKRIKNFFNKLKMILSIILINRRKMSLQPKHWLATFLFHLGIFIHALWLFTLPFVFVDPQSPRLFYFLGAIGMFFMLVFGLYLLIRKLRAPIRYYVPFEDYFVILYVLLISFTGLFAFVEVGPLHTVLVVRSLLTFSEITGASLFEKLHIFAYFSLLLILPLTRITHYIAVFFAHFILWDNRTAEELEPKLSKILKSYKVKWNAEHLDPELNWEEEAKLVKVRK